MNDAKHTPPPWDIEREELGIHFSDEEQEHAMPIRIGPVEVEFVDGDHRRIEADAALIRAAPELREACARALAYLCSVGLPSGRPYIDRMTNALDRAKAIVHSSSKSTGGK